MGGLLARRHCSGEGEKMSDVATMFFFSSRSRHTRCLSDWSSDVCSSDLAGSCGRPIGNEMRVVDEEDNELPDGVAGEIVMRGENVFKGYFKNDEATARAFRGGWFHTGDVGFRDAEGFYHIVDRKSDMIIRGGENIYPREIDELLYKHPSVAEAAAFGVPDPLYGEDVAAFVVLKEGREASGEEIAAYCRERLADYKCPKTVRVVASLPKGPTGKVLKRELQALWQEPGREGGRTS